MTPLETAAYCRISKATLYRLWAAGTGPRYATVGARRRVKASWALDFMLESEVAA